MADPSAPPLSLALHLRLSPPPLRASCGGDPSPARAGPSVPSRLLVFNVHLFGCHFLCAFARILMPFVTAALLESLSCLLVCARPRVCAHLLR